MKIFLKKIFAIPSVQERNTLQELTYRFERSFYVIYRVMDKYQFVQAEEWLKEQKNYLDKVMDPTFTKLTSDEKRILRQKVKGYLYKLLRQKDVIEETAPVSFMNFLSDFYKSLIE